MEESVEEQETIIRGVVALLEGVKNLKTSIDNAIKNYTEMTPELVKELYSNAKTLKKIIIGKTDPSNPHLLYPKNVVKALGVKERGCYIYFSDVYLDLQSLNRKWGLFQVGQKDKPEYFNGTHELYLQIQSLEYLSQTLIDINCFQGCLKGKVPCII